MYPNLKLELWRRGIRQNQLAKVLHLDETMLSKIINGYREVQPEVRAQIATLLESDETWLFATPEGDRRHRLPAPSVRKGLDGQGGVRREGGAQ